MPQAAINPLPGDGPLVARATIRAASILGLNNSVLAKVLGLSASQISRLSHDKVALDGKAFELGLLLIRLFRGLSGVVGNDDHAAKSWITTPNLALRGRPIDLIQTVPGLVNVVAYVDSRRAPL